MKNKPREEEDECIHHCSNCDQNLSDLISESIRRHDEELVERIEGMIVPEQNRNAIIDETFIEWWEERNKTLRDVLAMLKEK